MGEECAERLVDLASEHTRTALLTLLLLGLLPGPYECTPLRALGCCRLIIGRRLLNFSFLSNINNISRICLFRLYNGSLGE